MKRIYLLGIVGTAAFLLFFGAIKIMGFVSDPYGAYVRSLIPEYDEVRPPDSRFSVQYHDDTKFWTNTIARQSRWDSESEQRVLETILASPPIPPAPHEVKNGHMADPRYEAFWTYSFATTVIAERIGLGVPTPPDVVAALETAVILNLEHPHRSIRSVGLSDAQSARWLHRPDVRPLAERIRDHDPDERLANVARRFLLHADGMLDDDDREPCPTCPGHESGP